MPDQPTPEDQLQQLAAWLDDQAAPVKAGEVQAGDSLPDAASTEEVVAPVRLIDRGKRGWRSWVGAHPIALVGAAAALVLIVALTAIALSSGDDDAEDLNIVDVSTSHYTLIAATTDDNGNRVVELDANGDEIRDISWFPSIPGALDVSPDGRFAFVGMQGGGPSACKTDATNSVGRYRLDLEPMPPSPGTAAVTAGPEGPDPRSPARGPDTLGIGDPFALRPDGAALAYYRSTPPEDTAQGPHVDHNECDPTRELVVAQVDDGEVNDLGSVPLVDWPDVQDLAWLGTNQLAVKATDLHSASITLAAERGFVIPDSPELAYLRIISVEALLGGPETASQLGRLGPGVFEMVGAGGLLLPRSSVMAPAGGGQMLLAGPLDDAPFDLELAVDEVTGLNTAWRLSVWRGEDPAYEGTKLGTIEPSEFDLDIPTTVPPGSEPLTALDVTAAPDGNVYVTVAVTNALHRDEQGRPLSVNDPSQVALFRIAPDGVTHKLADGIVSVAVRPAPASTEPTAPSTGPSSPTLDPQADLVEIPEIVGLQADVARSRLEANGLVVKTVEEAHPVVALGEVFRQMPPAMTEVAIGTEVTITVSTGPDSTLDTSSPPSGLFEEWVGDIAYVTSVGSVVIDPADAEPRTIADLDADGIFTSIAYPWGPQLAASPDGRTLYVGTLPLSDFECDAQLYSIGVASGDIEPMARGHSPAVSPDGTKLAYVVPSDIGDPAVEGDCSFRIEVLDLDSGETKGWTDPWTDGTEPGHAFALPNTLVWEPDSETLIFQRTDLGDVANTGGFDPNYVRDDIFSFSTNQPNGEVLDAQPLAVDPPSSGEFWTLVGVTSRDEDGPHAVVRATCLHEGCPDRLPVAWVALSSDGLSGETSTTDGGGLLAGGDHAYLQYGTCETPAFLCLGDPSPLVALPDMEGGIRNPVEIATDVIAATWLP